MKIFNVENNVEKVYVQVGDIYLLDYLNRDMPSSIYEKAFGHPKVRKGIVMPNLTQDKLFIEFTEKEEVAFFKADIYIFDYKEIIKMPEEEIIELSKSFDIAKEEITMVFEGEDIFRARTVFDYKKDELKKILSLKKGENKNIELPLVEDSEAFSYDDYSDFGMYRIGTSLEPNKFLISKKTQEKILPKSVPAELVYNGIARALSKTQTSLSNYSLKPYISENKKYLIVECNPKKNEYNLTGKHKEKENTKPKKRIKKLIKNTFIKNTKR